MKLLDNDLEQTIIRYLIENPISYFEHSKVLSKHDICGNQYNQEIYNFVINQIIKEEVVTIHDVLSVFRDMFSENNLEWIQKSEKHINTKQKFKKSVKKLNDLYKRRKVFDLMQKAQEDIKKSENTFDGTLSILLDKLLKLDRPDSVSDLKSIQKISEENIKLIKENTAYKTGIEDLDSVMLGYIKSHVHIVGAYVGTGKSYWAIHSIKNLLENNAKVALFSLEMSHDENLRRILGVLTGKGVTGFYKEDYEGGNNQEDSELIDSFVEKYQSSFEIFDNCRTVAQIVSECKRMMILKQGLDVVFIDFIQNIKGTKDQLYETMREVAIACQELAKELKICVVLLSQLSNEFAQKGGVFQFKGAGEIAQIADLAMMLYDNTEEFMSVFPNEDLKKDGKSYKPILVDIVKSRHGQRGKACIMYEFPSGRVIDVPKQQAGNHYWLVDETQGYERPVITFTNKNSSGNSKENSSW